MIAALVYTTSDASAAELVALWDFNGNFSTSNGNPNFDLVPGGSVTLVPSPWGMAADFDPLTCPIDDCTSLACSQLDRLDTATSFTNGFYAGGVSVMGWVKPRSLSAAPAIQHDSSSCGAGPRLGWGIALSPSLAVQLRDSSDRRMYAQARPNQITPGR